MKPGYDGPAIDAVGLVKEFERGRRTIWQRTAARAGPARAIPRRRRHRPAGRARRDLRRAGAERRRQDHHHEDAVDPAGADGGHGAHPGLRRGPRGARGAAAHGRGAVRRTQPLLEAHRPREPRVLRRALPRAAAKEQAARIASALQAVKLDDRSDDYVERYSTGMRQRLVLARALLPDPELLLLDEPTVGLDPQSSRDLRDRVRDLQAQGRTVLLTTHYMEEADQLCDRIAIVDHGHIVALDTPAGLKRTIAATEVVHLEIESGPADAALLSRLERPPARWPARSSRTGRWRSPSTCAARGTSCRSPSTPRAPRTRPSSTSRSCRSRSRTSSSR